MQKVKVPFISFDYVNAQIKQEVLRSVEDFIDQQYYVLGPQVVQFEQSFADYCGTKYCVGVSNGLDALHLALRALDIQPGDEVIAPANTYIASILAILHAGARPILVEPRLETYNIDPEKIEEAITSKTKAIMPVPVSYTHLTLPTICSV